ncbi:hypothetical protein F5883DRAFT_211718 [Diaporthe sp. PMI_573]|nr:hypothetical protein F5883DRAFT_211718 [Diaporthaceae sp. PMI_573]
MAWPSLFLLTIWVTLTESFFTKFASLTGFDFVVKLHGLMFTLFTGMRRIFDLQRKGYGFVYWSYVAVLDNAR